MRREFTKQRTGTPTSESAARKIRVFKRLAAIYTHNPAHRSICCVVALSALVEKQRDNPS